MKAQMGPRCSSTLS